MSWSRKKIYWQTEDIINISMRTDIELKEEAENLFLELGMNMTTAFNIFLRQSVRQGKIPFKINLNTPNADTLEALMEV
ncbi:MAG: type II toxin-antitoxin system RelB/DinJ family antitoxin [Lachnospirales bacterium]